MENTRGTEDPATVPVSSKSSATGPKGGPLPVQNSPSTPTLTACAVQNSPSTPLLTACAVQSSPSTSRAAPLPVQNSPCSPEMAQYGAFSTCRESFIPFSPPRSQAGRVMYRSHLQEAEQGEFCTVLTTKRPSRANCVPNSRQRSSEPTQQHSWPHWCGGHRRVRREWRPGGPGRSTRE